MTQQRSRRSCAVIGVANGRRRTARLLRAAGNRLLLAAGEQVTQGARDGTATVRTATVRRLRPDGGDSIYPGSHSAPSIASRPRKSADRSAAIHQADAVVVRVSYVQVASWIDANSSWEVQLRRLRAPSIAGESSPAVPGHGINPS